MKIDDKRDKSQADKFHLLFISLSGRGNRGNYTKVLNLILKLSFVSKFMKIQGIYAKL